MLLHHCGIAPSSSFHAQRHFAQTAKFLKFVDDSLSDGRRWLAGEEFTAADIMCVFPLTTMRAFSGVDLSEYGNILAWLGRCVQREGYQRYREKADPELELMVDGKPPANFLEKLKAEGKL
jgi:glutathione S-transferase